MSGGKTTTRQRMINMMYLVLIAIMALNVAREILDSFVTIDEGLASSRLSIEEKTNKQMAVFQSRAFEQPQKFDKPFQTANAIVSEADEIVSYINRIKAICIAETEGVTMNEVYSAEADTVLDMRYVNKKDAYDSVTNILYGTSDEPALESRTGDIENYRSLALRARLEDWREHVLQEVDDESVKSTASSVLSFSAEEDVEGNLQSWSRINFYNVPLAASHSLLSKLQSDIRSIESDVVGSLYAEVEGPSMKFNRIKEAVIPVTKDVTLGGRYRAEIFLAAYDSLNPPEIRLGKVGVKVNQTSMELDGDYSLLDIDSRMIGTVDLAATGIGAQQREGLIIFKPAGLPEVRKAFKLDYHVSAPTLVASPTNMNVFYRGVDNPLSLSVPGFQDRDLVASIDNGSLKRTNDGQYIVNIDSGAEAKINVTAERADGSRQTFGPALFRVKSVPSPIARFAEKEATDNTVKKADLRAATGVAAVMKDFEFPVQFKVSYFEVVTKVRGNWVNLPARGNRLTPDQIELFKRLNSGAKFHIEGIKAKGPLGQERKLASISLRVIN